MIIMRTKLWIQKWTAAAVAWMIAVTCVMVVWPCTAMAGDSTTIYTDNIKDIQVGQVEVELDELIENNYMVTVPITMPDNPTYVTMQFGITWDTTRMTGMGARSTGDADIPLFAFAIDKTFLWISFVGMGCVSTDLCSVTFQIDSDVQVGDYFQIDGIYEDYNHNNAWYGDLSLRRNAVNIVSGGIQIVDSAAPQAEVKIPELTTTGQELEDRDYVIDVPVSAPVNTGFHQMAFGVKWDPAGMSPVGIADNIPDGLTVDVVWDTVNGICWITAMAEQTYRKSDICTLQFQVPATAKPGTTYSLTGCTQNAAGEEAYVENIQGMAGTLSIQDGKVYVASNKTASQFALGSISLPRLEVTLEELEQGGYELRVPVCITPDSSFSQMAFGLTWNMTKMRLTDCILDNTRNLIMTTTESMNSVWLSFRYQGNGTAYMGTSLCTLVFQISDTVEQGDVIALTQMTKSLTGEEPSIVGYLGNAGKLAVTDGEIAVVSEDEKNAAAIVKIPDITVDYHKLQLMDYEVTMTLSLEKNIGFSSLAFGVGWDAGMATPVQALNLETQYLGMREQYYLDNNMIWLNYVSVDPENQYVYDGSKLGDLHLELSSTVQPGDVIPIYGVRTTPDGSSASVVTKSRSASYPMIEAGSITITDGESDTSSSGTSGGVIIPDQTGNVLENSQIVLQEGEQTTLYFDIQTAGVDQPLWKNGNPSTVRLTTQNDGQLAYIVGIKPGKTIVQVEYLGRTYYCEVTVLAGDLMKGDLNQDEVVNMQDMVLMTRYILSDNGNCHIPNVKNGDINDDTAVTAADVQLLALMLLDVNRYLVR